MAINNKQADFTLDQLVVYKQKRNSIFYLIYGFLRLLGIVVENIYCVSSYLILSWIVLMPLNWIRSDLYSKLENYLYNSLLFIVSSWSLAAGAIVVETGDDYKSLIDNPTQTNLVTMSINKENGIELQVNSRDPDNETKFGTKNSCRAYVDASTEATSSIPLNQACSTDIHTTIPSNRLYNSKVNANSNAPQALETSEELPLKSDEACVIAPAYDLTNPSGGDLGITKNITIEQMNQMTAISNTNNVNRKISHPMTNSLDGLRSSGNHVLNGLKIHNSSKDTSPSDIAKPRILLLFNHISTADVPLIMQSFSTLKNQSLLWVLDALFKPTNFGLVSWSHDDFFIAKNKFTDGALRDHILKHPDRNLLVLFPEGGFWRKRLEGSNRYATKNNLPHTKYVTHPRFGAFKDIIDPSLNVTHIVDATLIYDNIKKPLSMLDLALGICREPVIVNYKIYNRDSVNLNEEWLRNLWLEKDKLLQKFYHDRNGFYNQLAIDTLRTIKLDWLKLVVVHLFYIVVFYIVVYKLVNN